ncbi:helix-turn-helix transcriptional regulator [Microbispora cellulosiformans]|uniref:Helix-turn-helix transcriptional regulator n=1 Tax=Microbispora cellulosiformans TaxID=2614688 RepID=A0A5J5K0W6_9ACTN|nr:XRE family transcriptional regulator [Microbispora cellulosiformans]KAA9377742.1 helix-turn-helix transcriptional regulator [Microbispora cellulosiformans]
MGADGTSRFDPAIGRRLRGLREARGLSLSELARRAGVGKATVSGLEHGTRNPTLETMYAIAAALSVPMSALTLDPGAPAGAASPVRGAAVVSTLLEVFREPGATYEMFRLRILPGVEQTSPAHPPGVTEHLSVIRGTIRTGPAAAPLTAAAGEHLSWAADAPHVYAALGGDEAQAILLIRTPHDPPTPTRRRSAGEQAAQA